MAEKKPSQRPKLSAAEITALVTAVKGGAETRGEIVSATGLTARRAQSALKYAVRRGHLVSVGEGNRTRYAASEKRAQKIRAAIKPVRVKSTAAREFAVEQHARGLVSCAEVAHALVVSRTWVVKLARKARILVPISNANVSSRPMKFVNLHVFASVVTSHVRLQTDQLIRLHRLAVEVAAAYPSARDLADVLHNAIVERGTAPPNPPSGAK
jgi:hypothetical protein